MRLPPFQTGDALKALPVAASKVRITPAPDRNISQQGPASPSPDAARSPPQNYLRAPSRCLSWLTDGQSNRGRISLQQGPLFGSRDDLTVGPWGSPAGGVTEGRQYRHTSGQTPSVFIGTSSVPGDEHGCGRAHTVAGAQPAAQHNMRVALPCLLAYLVSSH